MNLMSNKVANHWSNIWHQIKIKKKQVPGQCSSAGWTSALAPMLLVQFLVEGMQEGAN